MAAPSKIPESTSDAVPESPPMAQRKVTLQLEEGLHIRPCALIAESVRDHAGDVRIRSGNRFVDAKSTLDLMTLSAARGAVLLLEASGESADQVLDRLVALFQSNFEGDPPTESPSTPVTL
jgi:phosphotransferase system HPr (HPr) family protein